jgi:autotransporter translocation and assembly factor TamB
LLDWLGGQVDDGPYRIIDGDTVSIGKVTVQYRITHGITLEGPAGGCTPGPARL